jgi:tight adherence protein C
MILSFLAAGATFGSLLLAAYWLTYRPYSGPEERLRALTKSARENDVAKAPSRVRNATPALEAAATAGLFGLVPAGLMKRTEERLLMAGSPLTPAAFYASVLVLASLLPFALVMFLIVSGSGASPVFLILLPLLVMVGAWVPFAWLRTRVRRHQAAIRKELPDVLDLLTLCVESGLGLDAAFRRVSEETPGPLAMEIQQMLHEVDMGKPRRDALLDLAARAPIPEIGVVVNAMIQSQQMGTSLANTLRAQTQRLRLKRRQRAEQLARQASVKMAFPLVIFLMPSVFIVVLGPIAINVFRALSK